MDVSQGCHYHLYVVAHYENLMENPSDFIIYKEFDVDIAKVKLLPGLMSIMMTWSTNKSLPDLSLKKRFIDPVTHIFSFVQLHGYTYMYNRTVTKIMLPFHSSFHCGIVTGQIGNLPVLSLLNTN